ncbi:solute carrier family 26 [Seminavis robusta]|uniref:Solute carrier family 26 n=1 Tax=Seminavis robusta TaxID=568900 RepID=A0A9N8DSW0_9STRA|nr:solute carrier family 26 [Seminavis robusta]|eukprot:Sro254_g100130.1 solute carrier family 26 (534) ;mRNA; r:25364-27057
MAPEEHVEEVDENEDDDVSAWDVATSPMLTCFHSPSPARNHAIKTVRQRSLSVGDASDVDPERMELQIPDLIENLPQRPQETTPLVGRRRSGSSPHETTSFSLCVLYGVINATIVLPVLMSFGSIIYRDEAFRPYLNVLIKLTVVSGVVHQICFSALSTLPFAVGQVQDAGLIFLSSMAGMLVQSCRQRGADDETLLATTTVGLSLATALLGLALVVIGKVKLAQWVQLLPTCVVGGYLAYIGYFCGMSGVGIMAGTSQVTWEVFSQEFIYIAPGMLGGLFIYILVRTLRHMAVLPTCIIFLFCLFYLVLWLSGLSVEQATDEGWIAKTEPPPVWYHSWDYLKLDKVLWSTFPQLILTEIGMIFVVALSSSLDIAAIELELKQPLDYNSELTMIGFSNFISGMTGGYTGSYIFSQSIFSLRAGIRSRVAGFVLAGCEILFLVAPFSILAYVPNFFFGSLLSLICVDLVFEWLIDSRKKMGHAEYILCLATFVLILIVGVEYGIVLGVVLYVICKNMGVNLTNASNEGNQTQPS